MDYEVVKCEYCKWSRKAENKDYVGCAATLATDKLDQNNSLMCLIEYQGQQHYKQVELFQTEEQFLKQKENDNKKQIYCKEKEIKLVEIPYLDYQKINENYLKEKIYGI